MASFNTYYATLIKHEGGYANLLHDRGGETYKGIARNFHPNWSGWRLVDSWKQKYPNGVPNNTKFPDDQLDKLVYNFYEWNFWIKPSFHLIKNQSIAEILADFKINGGFAGNNVRQIQEKISTVPDGVWGPNSSRAVNAYANTKNKAQQLFDLIKQVREKHYKSLSTFIHFGVGWMKRLNSFTLDFSRNNKVIAGGSLLFLTIATAWYVKNNS